jgi:murein DD-endopeptidase MepM/ murein hydrolase activator NlpD
MKVKGVPGPLGLFCTASLVSALTLSVQSSIGYSQYDPGSRAGSRVIPIVTASIEEDAPVHPAVSGVVAVSHIVPIVTPRERDIAAAAAPARVSHAVSEEASRLVVRVKKGDTLMDILTKSGVAADDAEQAISSLKDVFNPRDLKTGQEVTLQFGQAETLAALEAGSEDSGSTFMSVKLRPAAGREVAVHRDASGEFAASDVQKALRPILYRSAGVIQSSLSEATDKAGLPRKVLQDVISAFSYDVDFQRDIQPGDSFEVLYERMADDEGNSVDTGKVEFAQMVLSGQRISLYRYTTKDGETGYFNQNGESVRKGLLRTPIDGARLSSGFGERKHPVLGYTRMHRGVDFAAPTGTPIYAAGNGVIVTAGRNHGYGNYIEIRHDADFHTAYGHLSRFAAGIHSGSRVKQGEVIGFVGATGLATGPHLHYEVIRDNDKVNPLSVKLPSGLKLHGKELDEFAVAKAKVDTMLARLPNESKVASNE